MHSIYGIFNYWESLKASTSNIRNPIYKWDCFCSKNASISDLKTYIHEIAKELRTHDITDELNLYSSNKNIRTSTSEHFQVYSVLFLIRCALICRLSDNWSLTYRQEYLDEVTHSSFGYKEWETIINTAERGLGRPDLCINNDSKSYCARILVEAGIPLYSLQNIKSNVVEGLKNIWEFSSSFPTSKAYHQAVRNFETSHILKKNDGTILKLPGGNAGCEAFFSMGTKLLQDVISARLKSNGTENDVTIFKNLGFENPSATIINYIFGTQNTYYASYGSPVASATPSPKGRILKGTIKLKLP